MLDDSLRTIASWRGPVACDTETSGLRWWTDTVGLVSFALGPADNNAFATRNVEGSVEALQLRMDAGYPTVFHNCGFDLHFLEGRGLHIRWEAVHDTLLKARLHDNLGEHDLDALGLSLLGIPKGKNILREWIVKANKLYKKKPTWRSEHGREATYLDVPEEILMPYARRDARLTWLLWDYFGRRAYPLYERERRIRSVMYVAERDGVEIDPSLVVEKRLRAAREERAAQEKLYAIHGSPLNLDSNPQLVQWLYKDLGLKAVSFTDGGQPQVNEFSLTSNVHPVTRLVNTYNKRHKTGEFLDSYLALMDTSLRIHPTINTLQARTHRFSLSDPNLQQIPTRQDRFSVREVFLAGYQGIAGWLIGADYDKQELRIAAEEAHDIPLLKALSAGKCKCAGIHQPDCPDVYVQMARAMLGKQYITGDERQAAKIAVLSMIYGAGAAKIAESFTVNTGRPYSIEAAKGIRSNFHAGYPNLALLMKQEMSQAKYQGHITNRWGRELNVEREFAYKATDYLVQSSGRDVMADALLNVYMLLPQYGGHLLWPIHDEILAWVPEEPTPELLHRFEEAVTCHKFSQPMTAKAVYGKTLAALH